VLCNSNPVESATQTLHRLTSVERYREAQLAAGLAKGRLHLAAYALGVAASGMTFVDGLVPRLLGHGNMQGLLFTCIGVPEYTSKPEVHPATPAPSRQ
jgi:hypothetical protein